MKSLHCTYHGTKNSSSLINSIILFDNPPSLLPDRSMDRTLLLPTLYLLYNFQDLRVQLVILVQATDLLYHCLGVILL